MSISIKIGSCTEDPRKLDKRQNFESSEPHTITVEIKDTCSIMRPDFVLISTNVQISGYNYIHVPTWGRYYFIDDIVTMPGYRTMIRCREDVLTSYADQISNLTGNVQRAESTSLRNALVKDPGYNVQSNRQCETIPFNRTPFAANYATDQVYLLTVVGGTDTSQ